jgi:hypothetical protein
VEASDNIILDPIETLLRIRWLDPSAEALRAIIRPDKGRHYFSLFLDNTDKRAKVRIAAPAAQGLAHRPIMSYTGGSAE